MWFSVNACNSGLSMRQRLIRVEVGRLVLHERVQRTAEQFEDAPQHLEETVGMVSLAPQERVQQRTAEETVELVKLVSQERVEDIPQFREETVAVVTLVPREVNKLNSELPKKIGEVPETASQDRRLQRTVELALCVTKSAENVCCVASSCGGIG